MSRQHHQVLAPTADELEPWRWRGASYGGLRRMVAMRLPPPIIAALHWLQAERRALGGMRQDASFANIVSELVVGRVAELRAAAKPAKPAKRRRRA